MERRIFVKSLGITALGLTILPKAHAMLLQSKVLDAFDDGNEIMFLGDSITHNGRYHTFIELYYFTRYPKKKIRYINSGISGDTTTSVLARMESDVLKSKPTTVVIMLGMNNTGASNLYNTNKTEAEIEEGRVKAGQVFESEYLKIINLLRNHCNPKFILLTPTAYDETMVSDVPALIGKNKTLSLLAEIVRKISVKEKTELVEFYIPFSELNTKLQANNSNFSLANKDRVHPPLQTHLYLGYLFLKSRKVSNTVATIKIDAKKLVAKDSINATVSNINKTETEILFDCLENSLPYPSRNDLKDVLNWVTFDQDINQELLIVDNLPVKTYDLFIDDVKIGSYDNVSLSKGVNLATIQTTPQNIQAQKVLTASLDYANKCSVLRKAISAEIMLSKDKIDVTNETIYGEYKAKKIAYNGYYKGVFDDFDKYKGDMNQLSVLIENAYQKVYSINQPINHKFKLISI